MERLLVTGVDTALGSSLALTLADRSEVLGLYDRYAVESAAVPTAAWNPDDPASLDAAFDRWQPQWLVHCGALSGSSWDDAPDARRAAREIFLVSQLAELAAVWGATLVILSSDSVFRGPRMFHDETSATSPTPRAALVREMERAVEDRDALVIRTHAYGWGFDAPDSDCFAQRICSALTLGQPIVADGLSHATPILASDLAEILWRAHETRLRGLYHIAGAERTSSHRFVTELAASLGIAEAVRWRQPAVADDDAETSLSSKRARRMLSVATPMLREGLDRFVKQRQTGWHEAWRFVGEVSHLQVAAA